MNRTVRQEGIEIGPARGLEQGRLEGRRVGQAEVIVAQLGARFGSVPPGLTDRLLELPADRLRAIAVAVPSAGSLADLGLADPPAGG